MIRWSASATDRVRACPASAALPHAPDRAGPAAVRGTHVHQYLRDAVVLGRERALAACDRSVLSLCERIDLGPFLADATDVRCEVAYAYDPVADRGRVVGYDLGRDYGQLGRFEVPGSADVRLYRGRTLHIYDYKTGSYVAPADSSGQLLLLGLAAARAEGAECVVVGMVKIDAGGEMAIDEHAFGPADLAEAAGALRQTYHAVLRQAGRIKQGLPVVVRNGDHCRYCPAKKSCPALARR